MSLLLSPQRKLIRLPRGITGYWPMDSASCAFSPSGAQVAPRDLIGNNFGVDAKSMGAAGRPPFDGEGIGYNFDATTNTYLTLSADPLSASTDFTILGWVNYRSFVGSEGLAVTPRVFGFSTSVAAAVDDVANPGAVYFDSALTGQGLTATNNFLQLNRWYLIAFAAVAGVPTSIYVNGTICTATAGGLGFSTTSGVWGIGCRDNSFRIPNARFAHFMVCAGTVLTAEEVACVYNSFFVPDEVMPALFVAAAPPTNVNFANLLLMGVG